MTDILKSENNVPMLKKDIGTSLLPTYTDVVSIVDSSGKAAISSDAVGKVRVSMPQSLIDTDFEYGTQPTKWDNLNLLHNRPIASYDPTQGISNTSRSDLTFVGSNTSAYQITNVTSSAKVVTVAINNTTGITVGLPIYITGTADNANVDGWWIVETISANTNFTFTVTNTPVTTALYDAFKS